ncbi:MAG TPA: aminotransferase class V-fold PLP-dependent enzyme, partial [Stellaceae bacterium]|nr:aminotransferase class V-fold PLP-dependent enzyme [Stellaceae bacterium]
MPDTRTKFRERLGLRPILNVSGTMTALGASIGLDAVARAMAEALPEFVEIDDLQRKASAAIAKATGAEAGYVTASVASGMTVAIAGAMTGADPARVEQLPDATGMKHEVPILMGHMVHYGAPIEQAIRLAGAKPIAVGGATRAQAYQLEAALNERTAAALFVVSHHVVGYGQLPLEDFAAICHSRGVPVIADLASEYDLKGFLRRGADVALYSAHKFLSGPTAGIVAGSKALIRAAYLQNIGIGRGMKVGKETIAGVIAALEAWATRDHAAVRAREQRHLDLWIARLKGLPGVAAEIVPDPTDNPLDRVKLRIDPASALITA